MRLMHYILQRLRIPPDVFFSKPKAIQAFIRASMIAEIEAENEAKGGS